MIRITTADIPEGYVGKEYYFELKAESDGSGVLHWVVEDGGVLPKGILLASDSGIISGIPEEKAHFTLYLVVTDIGSGEKAGRLFWINIGDKDPSDLRIITDAIPEIIAGKNYEYRMCAEGGTEPLFWEAEGLPYGIGIDGEKGVISGKAHYSGGFVQVSVTLSDADRNMATRIYDVCVSDRQV